MKLFSTRIVQELDICSECVADWPMRVSTFTSSEVQPVIISDASVNTIILFSSNSIVQCPVTQPNDLQRRLSHLQSCGIEPGHDHRAALLRSPFRALEIANDIVRNAKGQRAKSHRRSLLEGMTHALALRVVPRAIAQVSPREGIRTETGEFSWLSCGEKGPGRWRSVN